MKLLIATFNHQRCCYMIIVKSKNGIPLRLTDERWKHIITSHLDMVSNKEKLLETVKDPDMILKGVSDELRAIKFFQQTRLGPKYLVVAYKELSKENGFIITAYKTSRINKITRRGIIWKKLKC